MDADKLKELTMELKLKYLVLRTRIPQYDSYCKRNGEINVEDYINLKREDNLPIDMELRFYERNGLRKVRLCPTLMDDKDSRGYGIMMEWKNPLL